MKPALLDDLVCPACKGILELSVQEEDAESEEAPAEIIAGSLTCATCRESFPIVRGVPRMLLGELREALAREYPEIRLTRSSTSQERLDHEIRSKLLTMRSFGFEWREFSDIRPEGETGFLWYFALLPPETLHGRDLLDVGCGKGRHLYYSAQRARKAIGIDASAAVDAAFANTRHLANAHVVQADIFHLPFRDRSFDVVYSLGVLHHLTDPEKGFREILRFGRCGGDVLVYLYWSLEDEPRWKRKVLAAVTCVRRVTVRMPFRLLKLFSWIVAVGCDLFLVMPYRLLRRTRWSAFAETLPLKSYAGSPFIVLYQDQFDRFSAPIEHRYSRREVEEWFLRAGMPNVRILREAGWRACATLPATGEGTATPPGPGRQV